MAANDVLQQLATSSQGLSAEEATRRIERLGPNTLSTRGASAWQVLGRQVRSPLMLLLLVTAALSFFVGERTDAVIIGCILALSVGLGFSNEYRAEQAAAALHSQIRHRVTVRRDGHHLTTDVAALVPGDVVVLQLGEVVPADVRLLAVTDLACDESMLTGEPGGVAKSTDPVPEGTPLAELSSCALMGSVVHEGAGEGVVVATGSRTEFGRVARALGERHDETEFQHGLRQFSGLLVRVAGVLAGGILVINVALARPLIDAVLFALAIAVGITPQLLPAIVTTSLATGSRELARRKVLVKRLVCIEDLGNIDTLFTDKTGTLTEGRITFTAAVDAHGRPSDAVLELGLACNEATVEGGRAVGGNPLDLALWDVAPAGLVLPRRIAVLPFDHERRLISVVVAGSDGDLLVTKGAPEAVLERCRGVPAESHEVLDRSFSEGARVIAVAVRPVTGLTKVTEADEHDLELRGFLLFLDRPKQSAAGSLRRLAELGISVRIVTGDNPRVAERVSAELGMHVEGVLTGPELDELDEAALAEALPRTTVFARVSPEQKARVITAQRRLHSDVAFLGDGVNDAVALHKADVGISVDSATDVAKDAADIVLLEKDLDVLADGVVEGRRIFANTIKYVLMGTSSNFGNMFSAAVASAFLSFLPMLPSQILLNNLLYDASQMAIPTDAVDAEQLRRPAHWDIGFIRRFMMFFGPVSSLFDFATFAIMLWGFDAGAELFRSGWFVESLATQTLVIFVIRTRRVPFLRSRPSRPLLVAALGVVALGAVIPLTPLAEPLGFARPPAAFYGVLVALVVTYLALAEVAKAMFFRERPALVERRERSRREWHLAHHHPEARRARRVRRRASRWATPRSRSPAARAAPAVRRSARRPAARREGSNAR